MFKFFVILITAAMIESAGVTILKAGLEEVHGMREISVIEAFRMVKSGATNFKVVGGIALQAMFFGAFLYMLSNYPVSFVWPLTSLGFIATTLMARFILHEKVSGVRWAGVLMIAIGAALTGYSEAAKKQQEATAPVAATTESAALRSE